MNLDLIGVLLLHLSLLVSISSLLDSLDIVLGEVIEYSPGFEVSPELVESIDFLHISGGISENGAFLDTINRVQVGELGGPGRVASESSIEELVEFLISVAHFLGRNLIIERKRRVVSQLHLSVKEGLITSLDLKPELSDVLSASSLSHLVGMVLDGGFLVTLSDFVNVDITEDVTKRKELVIVVIVEEIILSLRVGSLSAGLSFLRHVNFLDSLDFLNLFFFSGVLSVLDFPFTDHQFLEGATSILNGFLGTIGSLAFDVSGFTITFGEAEKSTGLGSNLSGESFLERPLFSSVGVELVHLVVGIKLQSFSG
jgi:hypothetical protein